MNKVFIIGTGGHAKVVADCVLSQGDRIEGFIDDNRDMGEAFYGSTVAGKLADIKRIRQDHKDALFIIALGNNQGRMEIAKKFPDLGFCTAIHKSAQISPTAKIGAGTVVMPCAVVNAHSSIGEHCIINTACVVEHDNDIEDFVNISPGTVSGGKVKIGIGTFIGVGASIINNIVICGWAVLGAGCVVVGDIGIPGTYMGIPARLIEKQHSEP